MNVALSIVICSTRPLSTSALLFSLSYQLEQQDQVILIFDVLIESHVRKIFSPLHRDLPIEIHYNQRNEGLSYCRNLGMKLAKNRYLIFFDDDVLLPEQTLNLYRHFFSRGYQSLGGPLKLPPFYASIPRWLPPGFSSLLGIHTSQKRVWGGNFGFNCQLALQNQIYFKASLGRKNGGLQSGDETDFLQRYGSFAGSPCFIERLFVYHCIDQNRFNFFYLLRRSFWQGRSEYRKSSVLTGIKKEWKRSNLVTFHPFHIGCIQQITGMVLFFAFCGGILIEFLLTFDRLNHES